jgi:hypothetical protein
MITRKDMTADEWKWLVRIYQHDAGSLPAAVCKRLNELGLTEELVGDASVSDVGRSLVDHELLAERRNRLQEERH